MTYESNQLAKYNGYLATLTERESQEELMHYGIKGQKHGIRRFQYEDGTLTEEGKRRYGVTDTGTGGNKKLHNKYGREMSKLRKLDDKANVDLQKQKAEKYKKAAKTAGKVAAGAAALGTGIALEDLAVSPKINDKTWNLWYGSKRYKGAAKNLPVGSEARTLLERASSENDRQLSEIERFREATTKAKLIGFGLSASTFLGAAGVAAFNTAASIAAKQRTTPKGHAKAVAKRQAQYQKMQNTFANTPYAELLKKQAKQS